MICFAFSKDLSGYCVGNEPEGSEGVCSRGLMYMHGGGDGGQHGKNGWISEACASSSQQGVLTEWDVGGWLGGLFGRGSAGARAGSLCSEREGVPATQGLEAFSSAGFSAGPPTVPCNLPLGCFFLPGPLMPEPPMTYPSFSNYKAVC